MSTRTIDQLARDYAERVQRSLETSKNASVTESSRSRTPSDVLKEILAAIDRLTEDGEPISEGAREKLYAAIDRELGIRRGHFKFLKEGSVKSVLAYETYVAELLRAVRAAAAGTR